MELKLCLKEGAEPLEERFECFAGSYRERGQPHLREFIQALRLQPFDSTVYALSSMDRLCLLSQNYWDTPWWVLVECTSREGYKITADIPTELTPWSGAQYFGERECPELAAEDAVKAMLATRGWEATRFGIPGLDEIVNRELADSRYQKSVSVLREILCRKSSPRNVVWSPKGHRSKAAIIAWTSEREAIVYHSEGGYTYGRWGLARLEGDHLSARCDEDWYHGLLEALCASKAFVGTPPEGLYEHRDVSEWRARPDLKRFPPELPE